MPSSASPRPGARPVLRPALPLLSDADHAVMEAWSVRACEKNYGKVCTGVSARPWWVGPDGTVTLPLQLIAKPPVVKRLRARAGRGLSGLIWHLQRLIAILLSQDFRSVEASFACEVADSRQVWVHQLPSGRRQRVHSRVQFQAKCGGPVNLPGEIVSSTCSDTCYSANLFRGMMTLKFGASFDVVLAQIARHFRGRPGPPTCGHGPVGRETAIIRVPH